MIGRLISTENVVKFAGHISNTFRASPVLVFDLVLDALFLIEFPTVLRLFSNKFIKSADPLFGSFSCEAIDSIHV